MELHVFQVTPLMVNCVVVADGNAVLVVDPGEVTPALSKCIAGREVVGIVNTHAHFDHCGGNRALVESTGAPLLIHEADVPLLRAIADQGSYFGFPVERSPEPARLISEGDTIQVGSVTLEVLHTPGHSPGHIVLAGPGFVLAGDVLFRRSIGRTDLLGGDHEQLLGSIRNKLMTMPDHTVVYPGHGPLTTIGEERRENPFLTEV